MPGFFDDSPADRNRRRARRFHLVLGKLSGLINFGLLLATMGLALYAARQWKAANDTLAEIRRQTPAILQSAQAAADAVQVAREEGDANADSSKETLSSMKEQASAARSAAATALATSRTLAQQLLLSENSQRDTLALMREQADAALALSSATQGNLALSTKQLYLSERPRVVILSSQQPILFANQYGLNISLQTRVKNIGKSPAQRSWLLGEPVYYLDVERIHTQDELERTCNLPNGMTVPAGILISPDESVDLQKNINMPLVKFQDLLRRLPVDDDGYRRLQGILFACVRYESDLASTSLHAGIAYGFMARFSDREATQMQGWITREPLDPKANLFVPPERISFGPIGPTNGLAD